MLERRDMVLNIESEGFEKVYYQCFRERFFINLIVSSPQLFEV